MNIKLTLIVVLFTQILCAQNNNSSNKTTISESNWNSKTLLSELFEGEKVESLNAIKWKPYKGEFIQESYDGNCYTTIDSIYTFNNESLNYRIVVFKTDPISDENFIGLSEAEASTVGIALFSQEKKDWKLINFNRSVILTGHAGYLGQMEIIDLGNDILLLSINESEYHESDLHNYLISLNESNFGMTLFSTRTFHRLSDETNEAYKYETSEFTLTKAETEDSFPIMNLIKKSITIKEDNESTKVISTLLLEFDGYGFY